MAKLNLKKYPRKPKASASADTIKNYFSKCADIDKVNAAKKKEHAELEGLVKKLRSFTPGKSKASGITRRKKRAAAPKKKRKSTRR